MAGLVSRGNKPQITRRTNTVRSRRFGLAFLAGLVLLFGFGWLALPQPVAQGAGIGGWGGLLKTGLITNPVVRVRPSDGKTVILGTLNNSNPATAGIFLFTSDDNFQSARQLTPATNYPGFDTTGAPRAIFDIEGNLHIIWDLRPGPFVINYLKLDRNLNPVGGIRNLTTELYGGSNAQPANPDIATSLAPGSDGHIYLTMEEYPAGVGIWESWDLGKSWGSRFVPSQGGYSKSAPRVVVNPNGEVHVAYSPNGNEGLFVASKVPAKANREGFNAQGWKIFNIPLRGNPNIFVKTLAADNRTGAYLGWVMGRGTIAPDYDTASLARWDSASSTWQARTDNVTKEPSGQYNIMRDLAVAAGTDGTVVMAYTTFFNEKQDSSIRYSVSGDNGVNWSNPARIGNNIPAFPLGRTDLYFDGQNRFHYIGTFRGDALSATYYTNTNGGGTFAPAPPTPPTATPTPKPSLPDPLPTKPVQPGNAADNLYFAETGHNLSGAFRRFWEANGGLEQFGYPRTEPFSEINPSDGKTYTVQYFERNRFELHPENAGTQYEVLLGLLGNQVTEQRRANGEGAFNRFPNLNYPGGLYFAETGHNLRNAFKDYWQAHGGLAIYGYPISEEFTEVNPDDGKTYVVQYFERNRFEWHPEQTNPRYTVLLGLLGNTLLRERGWL